MQVCGWLEQLLTTQFSSPLVGFFSLFSSERAGDKMSLYASPDHPCTPNCPGSSEPAIWEKATQPLIDILSLLIFKIFDWVDGILCIAFRLLDSAFDGGQSSCYCNHGLDPTTHHMHPHKTPPKSNASDCTESENYWNRRSSTLYDRAHIGCVNPYSWVHIKIAASCKGLRSRIWDQQTHFESLWKESDTESSYAIRGSGYGSVSKYVVKVNERKSRGSKQDGFYASKARARWFDCHCKSCAALQLSASRLLYAHVHIPRVIAGADTLGTHNVLFLHGFLSSSSFWVDTLIPKLSQSLPNLYRLIAVDLLGFGKSPRPSNCFYTLADHIEAIQKSVIKPHGINSLHLVGHSMGCTVALALAAKFPKLIRSVTLIAPPYFPAPDAESAARCLMHQIAPKKIWPLMQFGASVMAWYEHIGTVVCTIVCKNHQFWEPPIQLLAKACRIPKYIVQDLKQHTHHSAWHIFHNTLCSGAYHFEYYLQILIECGCRVSIIHGSRDSLCPLKCSYALQARHPSIHLQVIENAGHQTSVWGREDALAKDLESIWTRSSSTSS